MHDSIHSRRNLTEEDMEDQKKEDDERFLIEQVRYLTTRYLYSHISLLGYSMAAVGYV